MVVKKIAILFSGSGSNLQAILEKLHCKIFNNVKIECTLCICNKAGAYGIERASKFNIPCVLIEHKNFDTRESFDQALVDELEKHNLDLVVLAGFMRILTPIFTQKIKAINLHPSILPLFKGANAINESFLSDMQVGGVSVHWVSDELDGGKIIAQSVFQRKTAPNLEKWESRIHELEHQILPETIIEILTKDI